MMLDLIFPFRRFHIKTTPSRQPMVRATMVGMPDAAMTIMMIIGIAA